MVHALDTVSAIVLLVIVSLTAYSISTDNAV